MARERRTLDYDTLLVETGLGNTLLQLTGLGEARTLADSRAIAQRAPTQVFTPRAGQRAAWDVATGRFAAMRAMRLR